VTISKVEIGIPNAVDVGTTDEALIVELNDGRMISAPLAWYPRLLRATQEERSNRRLIGKGQGIHGDSLDEDISVENLVTGRRSGESQASLQRWIKARDKKEQG